jgi:tagatose 1,6-diphosphate aldolase GatY/KbaY
MLVKSALDFIHRARQRKVALGAFNVFNIEMVQSTVTAAERCNAPVIIATEENDLTYCSPEVMAELVGRIAGQAKVPVILHLDHCTDLALVERCLKAGYASVMVDGSKLPFDENIRITKAGVEMAGFFGVGVEGELGIIPAAAEQDELDERYRDATNPKAAEEFARRTGICTLAPYVGTAHGLYSRPPSIRFDALEQIANSVRLPLVLHGGSGIPQDDVKRCIQLGIAKVNVGTDLRRTLVDTIVAGGSSPYREARHILENARQAMTQVVERWIYLLESGSMVR